MDEKIIWLLCLTVLFLVKDALIPLLKKLNGRKGNPINIDRLYQEFKDFKESQLDWNGKREQEIKELHDKLDERRE